MRIHRLHSCAPHDASHGNPSTQFSSYTVFEPISKDAIILSWCRFRLCTHVLASQGGGAITPSSRGANIRAASSSIVTKTNNNKKNAATATGRYLDANKYLNIKYKKKRNSKKKKL